MNDIPNTTEVYLKDKKFVFYASRTGKELMRGLAGINSLEDEHIDGMLFDFGVDHTAIMTPRGLKFPVEVAFISSDGKVLEIFTLDPKFNHNVYASQPVRYALEVPVGFFDIHNVAPGIILSI